MGSLFGGGPKFNTPARAKANRGLQGAYKKQEKELGALKGRVAPGFSDFRQAGLKIYGNARSRTLSDLRNNMSRRRVLGSSFAPNAESRVNAEFADREQLFSTQAYLQEIEQTRNLINEQYQARAARFSAQLSAQNMAYNAASASQQQQMSFISDIIGAGATILGGPAAGAGGLLTKMFT